MVLIRKESNYPLQKLCQNKNFNSCYRMTDEICKVRQAGDDHVCNIKYIMWAPYLVISFIAKEGNLHQCLKVSHCKFQSALHYLID